MSARERVQIDGKDLHEFGITVIRYEEDLMAAPKDGGGLDVEGIDGIIPTNSNVMQNLTGELEISIEGNTELEVLDTLRSFKQFIREGDYRQFTVDNNIGYYRLGKIVNISDYKLYEIEQESTAIGFFTFNITFMNAYEYSVNKVDLVYEGSTILPSPIFTFINSGAPNREAQILFEPIAQNLVGRIRIQCFVEEEFSTRYVNEIILGKDAQTLIPLGSQLVIDFNEPYIEIVNTVDGKSLPKMSAYNSGQFFSIPRGKIKITVTALNNVSAPITALSARVHLQFSPKYN